MKLMQTNTIAYKQLDNFGARPIEVSHPVTCMFNVVVPHEKT